MDGQQQFSDVPDGYKVLPQATPPPAASPAYSDIPEGYKVLSVSASPLDGASPAPSEASIKSLPPGTKIGVNRMPLLQLDPNPPETAIPRAINAAVDRIGPIDATPSGLLKREWQSTTDALGSDGQWYGEFECGEEGCVPKNTHEGESQSSALHDAIQAARRTVTTKDGLTKLATKAGSRLLSSVAGIAPLEYVERARHGDVAGAIGEAALDTGVALAQRYIGSHVGHTTQMDDSVMVPEGRVPVTIPGTSETYHFPSKEAADAFRKSAGIQ